MKFCPTCQTRYDEEVLRFCIQDGTPLVEENQPIFTELPSESVEDDFDEETVIRRKKPDEDPVTNVTKKVSSDAAGEVSSPRIIIPTTEIRRAEEAQVRIKTTQSYRRQPPPRQANTTKIITLSILGTLIVLAGAGIIFMFLNNSNEGNQSINVNTNLNSIDTNLNTNLGIDNSLFDPNANLNTNLDTNFNTDFSTNTNIVLKTPTPTPVPTATATAIPTPVPSPSETPEVNNNTNNANNSVNLNTNRITPRPTLTATPPPVSTPRPTPRALPSVVPTEIPPL